MNDNMTKQMFQKLEAKALAEGFFGYINSTARTADTDRELHLAAVILGLSEQDLYLWVTSKCARHFMDGDDKTVKSFVQALASDVPQLRLEVV